MVRTYCDFCHAPIETPDDQVNLEFNSYGCTGFPNHEYNFHVSCATIIRTKLVEYIERDKDGESIDGGMAGRQEPV